MSWFKWIGRDDDPGGVGNNSRFCMLSAASSRWANNWVKLGHHLHQGKGGAFHLESMPQRILPITMYFFQLTLLAPVLELSGLLLSLSRSTICFLLSFSLFLPSPHVAVTIKLHRSLNSNLLTDPVIHLIWIATYPFPSLTYFNTTFFPLFTVGKTPVISQTTDTRTSPLNCIAVVAAAPRTTQ